MLKWEKLRDKCNGCSACALACPQACITMQADAEGFYYPRLDAPSCVQCGRCDAACPLLKPPQGVQGRAYACMNQNEEIRMQSSSGGVFTALAERVLQSNGVVFSAALHDDLTVRHMAVRSFEELALLRGSKYVQSQIGTAYSEAKKLLEGGTPVLFSGTPCQIAGLRSFLGRCYDNLITQDIICHGVPSPKVWENYITHMQNKFGSTVLPKPHPSFRNKEHGWRDFSMVLHFESGNRYSQPQHEDVFMQAFLRDLCLRPSCYQCHFKSLARQGDITLADFWGVETVLPDMDDNKGTSLVLVNTGKGRRLFEAINSTVKSVPVDINEAIRGNPACCQSAIMPANRKKFMREVTPQNIEALTGQYGKRSLTTRVLSKCKRCVKRMCGHV